MSVRNVPIFKDYRNRVISYSIASKIVFRLLITSKLLLNIIYLLVQNIFGTQTTRILMLWERRIEKKGKIPIIRNIMVKILRIFLLLHFACF